jgi:NADPH2:quinone reductase
VLIAGGAGAVSHYAIQFAKALGATVIVTVSSPAKAEVARKAGADHAIDYRSDDVGARVMEITQRHGVDASIELDIAANAKLVANVLRPKGKVVIYGTGGPEAALPAYFCLVNSITLQFFLVYELDRGERDEAIAAITSMLLDNRLMHNIALTLPLERIVEAHEAVESGRIVGNVVLQISKS